MSRNVFYYCSECVFYYCRTYDKAVRRGGRRRVEDMCYERRRAEACVDESAHHALVNRVCWLLHNYVHRVYLVQSMMA